MGNTTGQRDGGVDGQYERDEHEPQPRLPRRGTDRQRTNAAIGHVRPSQPRLWDHNRSAGVRFAVCKHWRDELLAIDDGGDGDDEVRDNDDGEGRPP
jgi:hypothetical protein